MLIRAIAGLKMSGESTEEEIPGVGHRSDTTAQKDETEAKPDFPPRQPSATPAKAMTPIFPSGTPEAQRRFKQLTPR